MKIKAKLEDFVVEEVLKEPPKEHGPWRLWKMTKERLNTQDAVSLVARALGISPDRIGYAGRKDRHALTTQYISVPARYRLPLSPDSHLHLEETGYAERPIAPADMAGNLFRVVIRDISEQEADSALQEKEIVETNGFINYFDDQRFGPWDESQGFLAELIVKGHFNGALKHYLTRVDGDDKKKERERKVFFGLRWGDWAACRREAATLFEKQAFDHLIRCPKDHRAVVLNIPGHQLSFHFASYQSFLWNEVARRWVSRRAAGRVKMHEGLLGPYIFSDDTKDNLAATIPTVASRLTTQDPDIKSLYEEVLSERGLRLPLFNLTRVRQTYFKSLPRRARVIPENLNAVRGEDDSTTNKKYKITLSFFLPRGSFATMFVKRIFSRAT